MVDILQFYKETTERPPEDQILEKFHHAGPAENRQYSAPTSPNMYPANYMGKQFLRTTRASPSAAADDDCLMLREFRESPRATSRSCLERSQPRYDAQPAGPQTAR